MFIETAILEDRYKYTPPKKHLYECQKKKNYFPLIEMPCNEEIIVLILQL